MSNYKKEQWSNVWDALFWDFIEKHSDKIKSNIRMRMMISLLNKKNTNEIKEIKKISNNFKESIFS